MCLQEHEASTTALLAGHWPLTGYKVLKWDFNGHFYSPYQNHHWKVGTNVSNRSLGISDSYDQVANGTKTIFRGFHVFLDRDAAEEMCFDDESVVAELICEKEHLVAAGVDNNGNRPPAAVFASVTLTVEEHARLLAQAHELPVPEEDEWDIDDDDWDDGDDWEEIEDDDDWDDEEEWEDEEEEEEPAAFEVEEDDDYEMG